MEWLASAQREAEARGWKAVFHIPDREAYARGLPTLQMDTPEQAAALRVWLAERLEASGQPLACNRNVRLLQIHDAAVGKGLTLLELARVWGLAPSQVLAIGDSANDFSMLDGHLGLRCATVGNADPAIKEIVQHAGGYVASRAIGAGVVEILQAHIGRALP
jgi:hydroxymethylpyrimidine pyrophosphatase-like HAD family hydrolase